MCVCDAGIAILVGTHLFESTTVVGTLVHVGTFFRRVLQGFKI